MTNSTITASHTVAGNGFMILYLTLPLTILCAYLVYQYKEDIDEYFKSAHFEECFNSCRYYVSRFSLHDLCKSCVNFASDCCLWGALDYCIKGIYWFFGTLICLPCSLFRLIYEKIFPRIEQEEEHNYNQQQDLEQGNQYCGCLCERLNYGYIKIIAFLHHMHM